jgi:hypothetical protein
LRIDPSLRIAPPDGFLGIHEDSEVMALRWASPLLVPTGCVRGSVHAFFFLDLTGFRIRAGPMVHIVPSRRLATAAICREDRALTNGVFRSVSMGLHGGVVRASIGASRPRAAVRGRWRARTRTGEICAAWRNLCIVRGSQMATHAIGGSSPGVIRSSFAQRLSLARSRGTRRQTAPPDRHRACGHGQSRTSRSGRCPAIVV